MSSIICCCSVAQLCQTPCNPMDCSMQASLSFTISQSLLKLMSIELVVPSNHLLLCCPLLLRSIFPSIFPRVFKWVSSLHQVAKVLELQHPSFKQIFRVDFSFKINCFDLLSIQTTLKNLLQHHSLKASILRRSAFFIVQHSYIHDYWKNHSFD